MKEDKDFRYMCNVELSENPSQVLPNGVVGYQRGACSTVNVEPRDSQDEVAAVFTLRHEGIHARVIAEKGPSAIENERGAQHEIEAHEETVKFGRDWLKRERQESKRRRIREEIAEEERAIWLLQTGATR